MHGLLVFVVDLYFRARVGLALGIISLGLLASAPIQGALLGKNPADFVWIRPTAYSAVSFREVANTFSSIYSFPSFFFAL